MNNDLDSKKILQKFLFSSFWRGIFSYLERFDRDFETNTRGVMENERFIRRQGERELDSVMGNKKVQ